MTDLGFKEVDRVATGGLHSPVLLLITYDGNEADYHDDGYVCVENGATSFMDDNPVHRWYSLRLTDGHDTSTLESFKKTHDSFQKKPIVVRHFES